MAEAAMAGVPSFLLCNNDTLRKAMRNLGQLYDDAIAPANLRGSQFSVLVHINELDEPTVKALATALVMDISALGHTLKPLIRDGLVRLVPNPDDGRSKRVTLTKAGQRKVAEATELWRDAQGRFETVFGADEARNLRQTLLQLSSEAFTCGFRSAGDVAATSALDAHSDGGPGPTS